MTNDSKVQLPLEFFEPDRPNLSNFVVGENLEAVETLRAVQEGKGPQFVYLYGMNGSGKTFLLTSLGGEPDGVPDYNPHQRIYVVDDVNRLQETDLQRLFNLANDVRAHPGTTLIVSGDRSPAALKAEGMREDVTSRLSWGAVFELVGLSDDQRRRKFMSWAQERGLIVSPEVFHWIETYLPRDMRTLNWLFEGVDRYSMSTKRPLTIPLIKEWLSRQGRENLF